FASQCIPNADRSIGAPNGQAFAVGTECNAVAADIFAVTFFEGEKFLASLRIKYLVFIGQAFTVWAKGQAFTLTTDRQQLFAALRIPYFDLAIPSAGR